MPLQRLRLKVTAKNLKTGLIESRVAPVGAVVEPGQLVHFAVDGYTAWTGQGSVFGCVTTPTPTVGAPIWLPSSATTPGATIFNLPKPAPSAPYGATIPLTAAIAYAGQSITRIVAMSLPGWLGATPQTDGSLVLSGTAPAGTSPVSVLLRAIQSDGQYADKTFTLTPEAVTVSLYVSYNHNTRILTSYVGPYSAEGLPEISLYDAPSAYPDRGKFFMTRITTLNLPNPQDKAYSYIMAHERIITGDYVPKIVWLNQTLYGSFTLVEEIDFVQEIALSPNAPELQGDFGPLFEGVEEETVPTDPGCTQHAMLTVEENNALPIVTIYEYYNAPGPARVFASRAEAISLIPLVGQSGALAKFDQNRCTDATPQVGSILYNDNRPEHLANNTNFYYPVEAGWWGWNRVSATDFYVLQTDACGNIITKEHITL